MDAKLIIDGKEIPIDISGVELPVSASGIDLKDADIVLVKVGNDQYPVIHEEPIKMAMEVVKGALKLAGINVPVIGWNHAIEILPLRITPKEPTNVA